MSKSFPISAFCSIFALFLVSIPASAQPLVFSTSFNCSEWNQNLGGSDSAVCSGNDGIRAHGDWTTSAGSVDQITSAANNPAGGGGRGFRHWRGPGHNNNGGGLFVQLPETLTEFWISYYVRYQAGFAWDPPGFMDDAKDIYFVNNNQSVLIFRYQWAKVGMQVMTKEYRADTSWNDVMGGDKGDGRWHRMEFHVKSGLSNDGILEAWVDGQKIFSRTNITTDNGQHWKGFVIGSNNTLVAAGPDVYTDYDDIAISTVGRVGGGSSPPPSSTSLEPPTNLRVIQ